MKRCLLFAALSVLVLAGCRQPAGHPPALADPPDQTAATEEPKLLLVSDGVSPKVSFGAQERDGQLVVKVHAEGKRYRVDLGVAGQQAVQRTAVGPVSSPGEGDGPSFTFTAEELGVEPGTWDHLRLAFAVTWLDGPDDPPVQSERFRHLDAAAPHAGLSADPEDWAPFSLAGHQDRVAGRDRIRLTVEQPVDGKLTVVIEDPQGRRLRNLVAGQPTAQGRHDLEWDGLDDFGRLVPPGTYRWRSAHHPGVRAEFLSNFLNGGVHELWSALSNHGRFTAACTNGEEVFLAASITEGGYDQIALDAEGRWLRGYLRQHGTGHHGVAIAADRNQLYTIHDGLNLRNVDRTRPKWQAEGYLTLTRYDLATTKVQGFGRQAFRRFATYEHGPGAKTEGTRDAPALAGAALLGGKLYVASRAAQALLVLNPANAEIEREVSLPEPGPLTVAGEELLAVSGEHLVFVDPANGDTRPFLDLAKLGLEVAGVATDGHGQVYLSDAKSHTVRVFDLRQQPRETFGEPGGPYEGSYVPERMVRPQGLAVFGGKLWVTEDRRNPKRAVSWALATRQVTDQIYGNPPYGSPGGAFDPRDATQWLGTGARWQVDLESGEATVKSILQKEGGHLGGAIAFCVNYRYFRQGGRTFIIGQGKSTIVSELLPDGSLRDLALLGPAHSTLYHMGWDPVPGFRAAFEGKFPKASVHKKYGGDRHWRNMPIFWVDANGDGLAQQEEFEIGEYREDLWPTGWGHCFPDLTLRVVATRPDGQHVLVSLVPDGFRESGAPNYPTWAEALAAAPPLSGAPGEAGSLARSHSSLVDFRGNLILNSEPYMAAYDPAGQLLWHYPNQWVNVHGSHRAPLPSTGEMQGNLFFLGCAPLDRQGDVTMLVGNHGRFFVHTTDGLYLDEVFRDCRVGGPNDAQFVGGEAFGGVFGRADDGRYLLQTGPGGYRIYQLHGLDQMTRQSGTIEVTAAQLELAAERRRRLQEAEAPPARASIPFVTAAPKIDGRDDDWPDDPTAKWDRRGRFATSVRAARDRERLYLLYEVRDPSPWRNTGADWRTMFKTGDCVDFQIGTDPQADPQRRQAAPGDLRLLVAPGAEGYLAVLYNFRLPEGGENPVRFDSPWRSYQVDSVTRLESLQAAHELFDWGYRLELSVPLADLGLGPAPGALRGDFGVLFGDAEGSRIALRSYWANPHTGLMYDVPGEAMITPHAWGDLGFEPPPEEVQP